MDIAFLIVRLILGLGLAAHGAQKLFGWFGGHGLAGTGGFFEGLGFRPGKLFALMAGLGEMAGGLLTALGLGGALGPVSSFSSCWSRLGRSTTTRGSSRVAEAGSFPALNIAASLAVAFGGNGSYSLDSALGFQFLTDPLQIAYALAAAVIVAALNLLARRPAE